MSLADRAPNPNLAAEPARGRGRTREKSLQGWASGPGLVPSNKLCTAGKSPNISSFRHLILRVDNTSPPASVLGLPGQPALSPTCWDDSPHPMGEIPSPREAQKPATRLKPALLVYRLCFPADSRVMGQTPYPLQCIPSSSAM